MRLLVGCQHLLCPAAMAVFIDKYVYTNACRPQYGFRARACCSRPCRPVGVAMPADDMGVVKTKVARPHGRTTLKLTYIIMHIMSFNPSVSQPTAMTWHCIDGLAPEREAPLLLLSCADASCFLAPRNFGSLPPLRLLGRSSDFVPPRAPSRSALFRHEQWTELPVDHKGTYSCGTVGDSHLHSLLIAVVRTSTNAKLHRNNVSRCVFRWISMLINSN